MSELCLFVEIKPASTLDLRDDASENATPFMGDRSKSVPGLNAVSYFQRNSKIN